MKCDLHRHFGGSLSAATVATLANISKSEAEKVLTYQPGELPGYENFFKKFDILNTISWNYHNIAISIADVVWGLKREGIDYAEIKFSIGKYLKSIPNTPEQIILWICKKFDDECSKWGIEVDLVLSLQYESDRDFQKRISQVIRNDLVAEYIAGIDLVGNEKFFDVDFYKPILDEWHDRKKLCVAHVGEINHPEHVKQALQNLNIDRVCHGIAAADDIEIAKIARDKNIAFDIGISSNVHTGVAGLIDHPVKRMIDNGFIINIGTDDPVIFSTDLNKEYRLLKKIAGLSDSDVQTIYNNSIDYSAKGIFARRGRGET